MKISSLLQLIAVAVLAMTALVGCDADGNVTIQNRTGTELSGSIDDRGFALSGFESLDLTIKIGSRFAMFGAESKDVAFAAESCTRFPFESVVTVERGGSTTVTVAADATCVTVQNQAEFDLVTVLRRPSGTSDWGENRIDAPLHVAESVTWRLEPDIYDFLLVDICDDSTLVEDDTLTVGLRDFIVHTGDGEGCAP